ncbi:MAG: protein-L-isoaspartate(D-aspartate) O-methyltransferase [Pseudomonadales bacterium]|nr:protein-L-isoaspartate(D-aspartate) O-methyltransferase [Pseudomonadales bacterium]
MQSHFQGIGMTSQRTRDRLIKRLSDQGISDLSVLDVIRNMPRHIFIEEALAHRAYEDTALPIGRNQTISQPYIVAKMTETLLAGGPLEKVLEIGTGSGYQAAILSQMVGSLYSVERIKELQDKARDKLRSLKIRNVYFRHVGQEIGWQERGPYDGIMVTAAPEVVPQVLLDQLTVGGRMVIPVGSGVQELKLIVRTEEGFDEKVLEFVKFVPFVSGVS